MLKEKIEEMDSKAYIVRKTNILHSSIINRMGAPKKGGAMYKYRKV